MEKPADRSDKPKEANYFEVTMPRLILYCTGLPFVGATTCVVLSLLWNFEQSTATHCKVKNYLPSISSAIGGYTPQRYIWRLCIAYHAAPRFVLACIYYNMYRQLRVTSCRRLYDLVVLLAILLHLVENVALIILSMVSSTENDKIHENSFILFMVCSLVYMLLSCILMKWGYAADGMADTTRRIYKWKIFLFVTNFTSFMVAVYFFFRHNTYCEPGVYTLFAFGEYVTVATNIVFHGLIVMEFTKGKLHFTIPVSKDDKKKP